MLAPLLSFLKMHIMTGTQNPARIERGIMKKLIMVLMLLVSGCATTGHQFDMSATDRIKIGQTTQAEVIAILGPPIGISKTGDGA